MKTTKVNWVSVNKQGYPSKEEYGHYPTVLVSMKMVSETTRVPFGVDLKKQNYAILVEIQVALTGVIRITNNP